MYRLFTRLVGLYIDVPPMYHLSTRLVHCISDYKITIQVGLYINAPPMHHLSTRLVH
jgi:fumarate reductase subunit D